MSLRICLIVKQIDGLVQERRNSSATSFLQQSIEMQSNQTASYGIESERK